MLKRGFLFLRNTNSLTGTKLVYRQYYHFSAQEDKDSSKDQGITLKSNYSIHRI